MSRLRKILIFRKHVIILLMVLSALFILRHIINICIDIVESTNTTNNQDKVLQDSNWQRVIDSRIVRYQSRLEMAIRNKEWHTASDELEQLCRTVKLKRRLFNVPEINVEEQLKQYETLIRKGINSYKVKKRTSPTYQSESLGRGRNNSWEGSRFAPRSNNVQQDPYRVPSQTSRSSPPMSHQQEE